MTKNLEQKIFDRFKFYRPELSNKVSLMCFGFECGDGWFQLLWNLSEKIDAILIKYIPEQELAKRLLTDDMPINISQVKEKFGTLRFYVNFGDISEKVYYEIEEAINDAEEISAVTCELCGEEGKQQSGGWIRTLCDKCEEERNSGK